MDFWFSKNLGDEPWAWEPLAEVETCFSLFYTKACAPEEMAVFTRHESEGRLHCQVIAYFSPAASAVAQELDAHPCAKPSPEGLSLLAGTDASWGLLFPDQ